MIFTTPGAISLYVAVFAISLAVASYTHGERHKSYGMWPVGDVIGMVGAAGMALFAILLSVIFYPSLAVGRTSCAHYATRTGVPTKFVQYNSWDTGNCLVRFKNKWIPRDNMRLVVRP